MATKPNFVEFVCDQIAGIGVVRFRKMFGEYMVYLDDRPIFLLCDNTVFVKVLSVTQQLLGEGARGVPYPGAKEHYVLDLDQAELVREIAAALVAVIPIPVKKKKKPTKASQTDEPGVD